MILNNKQDIKEVAMEIAEVRRSGEANMLCRQEVIDSLFSLGYDFSAEHLSNNKSDYLPLLEESGKY